MDRTGVEASLFFLASIGNLFLAMFVGFRAYQSRGRLPIALLCVSLFLWDICEGLQRTIPEARPWRYLALVGSSLAPAFLWHFVVVFCRRERAMGKWVVALYTATAPFALSTAGAIASPWLQSFVDGVAWNLAYLFALFPFLVWSAFVVSARRREVRSELERNALNFVVVGIAIGTLTGMADLVVILGSPLPFLGHIGSLACTIILAAAIFRHGLLESETPVRHALLLLAVAIGAVLFNMWLFRRVKPEGGPTLLAIGVVTVVGFVLYRQVLVRWYERSERRRRLALVGTMAAGVAHEIKNPLASIKGATQLVQRELEDKAVGDGARDYLKLVVGEVDRLNGVIEDFLSFARPREPRFKDVSLNELVEGVLTLQGAALPPGVEVRRELDPMLPSIQADPELLKQALLNVLKNAVDAVGDKGLVTVRTRSMPKTLSHYEVIEVEDSGPGISPDDLDRIFQPFYTTKTRGTGLGLAIAARVLEAHDGQIAVENVRPRGAKFSFHIPHRRS
ncbi:MAG: hypothetical protein HYY16_09165 [Planctomycetes bacterium]|nr:hypothetical protein [Planctomycetota bacterium]